MGKVAREAAKLLAEDLNRLKATLAKQGKTLDDFLEEILVEGTEHVHIFFEERSFCRKEHLIIRKNGIFWCFSMRSDTLKPTIEE